MSQIESLGEEIEIICVQKNASEAAAVSCDAPSGTRMPCQVIFLSKRRSRATAIFRRGHGGSARRSTGGGKQQRTTRLVWLWPEFINRRTEHRWKLRWLRVGSPDGHKKRTQPAFGLPEFGQYGAFVRRHVVERPTRGVLGRRAWHLARIRQSVNASPERRRDLDDRIGVKCRSGLVRAGPGCRLRRRGCHRHKRRK